MSKRVKTTAMIWTPYGYYGFGVITANGEYVWAGYYDEDRYGEYVWAGYYDEDR
ncbi:membrane protein [Microbacterium phage Bee17]|nr:membrane protein [Microbacterium phage Bee17]